MSESESRQYYPVRGRRLTRDWGNVIGSGAAKTAVPLVHATDHFGYIQINKDKTTFCTGSTYEGHHDALGFAGFGTYVFPHGARYVGYFFDGRFHGEGTITYPKGAQIDGIWRKGKLMTFSYTFADGLEYSEPWLYAQFPDRTFHIEQTQGLRPAGIERTANKRLHSIPENTYDTGDGYFDPEWKVVLDRRNHKILRIIGKDEEDLIRTRFRENRDRPVGYVPELYEYFIMGTEDEVSKIEAENRSSSPERDVTVANVSVFTETSETERVGTCYNCTFVKP